MGNSNKNAAARRTPDAWGSLPAGLRVLHVAPPRQGGTWLSDSLAADSAVRIDLLEVTGAAVGLERLQEATFHAVLITHEPPLLDALPVVEAVRGAGGGEAVVVLGVDPELEMSPLAYEVGADAYLCTGHCSVRGLLWTLARAVERNELVRENRRLIRAERQQLEREHHEAEHVLCEQRALVRNLEALHHRCGVEGEDTPRGASACAQLVARSGPSAEPAGLPVSLVSHYRELLRTHVIMGAGGLADEMRLLAELLATAGVTAQQTLQLHLQALEELVRGLGARSTRHVLTRADLLVLEMMLYLAEEYRRRSQSQAAAAPAAIGSEAA